MKHLVSRELHAYWNRLRGARMAPERGDLDPAAIRSILADTFLLDVAGGPSFEGRDFIVRLSGTRLNALCGLDLRGQSLPSLWRPEDRFALRELLDLVLDDQAPVVAGSRAAVLARGFTELETLFLPLRHHGKTHARILGSMVSNQNPSTIGLPPVANLALTSFRSITSAHGSGIHPAPPGAGKPSISRPHGRFMVYEGGGRHGQAAIRLSPRGFRQP